MPSDYTVIKTFFKT